MKYTLSVLVEDESGVLTRIASLFARRGFNIASLAVGPAEEKGTSRITMVLEGDISTVEQLIKQLYKQLNILKVQNITDLPSVERELMLVKIHAPADKRAQIIDIATIFRAKIVDFAESALILEITGDPGKVVAIKQLVEKFGIIEVARTGKVSLTRASKVNTQYLRENKIQTDDYIF